MEVYTKHKEPITRVMGLLYLLDHKGKELDSKQVAKLYQETFQALPPHFELIYLQALKHYYKIHGPFVTRKLVLILPKSKFVYTITDRGNHALGQVVNDHFDIDHYVLLDEQNRRLSPYIKWKDVLVVYVVPADPNYTHT